VKPTQPTAHGYSSARLPKPYPHPHTSPKPLIANPQTLGGRRDKHLLIRTPHPFRSFLTPLRASISFVSTCPPIAYPKGYRLRTQHTTSPTASGHRTRYPTAPTQFHLVMGLRSFAACIGAVFKVSPPHAKNPSFATSLRTAAHPTAPSRTMPYVAAYVPQAYPTHNAPHRLTTLCEAAIFGHTQYGF
jgi:hypothetical protein